jgi:hypothetical protein
MNEAPTALEYLIPRRINQGFEFAPGWGLVQAATAAAGLLLGAGWFLGGGALHLAVPGRLLPALVVGGIGIMAARPMPDGSTPLDLVGAFRGWLKRPKRYLYDWSLDDC